MIISIITPFYYGNRFLTNLINSVNKAALLVKDRAIIELIIVNDSPGEKVVLPRVVNEVIRIRVYNNEKNVGIQKTRVRGLNESEGEWVVFLDQDDELVPEGFAKMIDILDEKSDVVVGNLFYEINGDKRKFYKNAHTLKNAIKFNNFLTVRNMIPSPGHCLIKKEKIPRLWKESHLTINGSDDYLLWIIMFKENCLFNVVEFYVYKHNDNGGNNLSLNIDKMYKSSKEMCLLLKSQNVLSEMEQKKLEKNVEFKYLQDSKKLTFVKLFKNYRVIARIVRYKIGLLFWSLVG